jgi:hypothetical protein
MKELPKRLCSTGYGGAPVFIYKLNDGTSFEKLNWKGVRGSTTWCHFSNCSLGFYCSEDKKKRCIEAHCDEIETIDILMEL